MRAAAAFALGVILIQPSLGFGEPPGIYDVPVGDPARRAQHIRVVPDIIVDTHTQASVSPEQVAAALDDVQILLIGESHTSMDAHRVQLRMIRALQARGRSVVIALEMFPVTEQPALDAWNAGHYTEEGFLTLGRWYEHWGYNWRLYRDIFLHARAHRLPMYAVNGPRETIAAVRRKGFDALTAGERQYLPPAIAFGDPDHLAVFKSAIGDADAAHGMTSEMWSSMAAAQATWDGTMAWHTSRVLERHAADPKPIVVVLVGSGHVVYGVGIQKQVQAWHRGRVATLVPVPAMDEDGTPTPPVRATYADVIWGLPKDDTAPFPRLGLSTRSSGPADGQREVIMVEQDSLAQTSGFRVKDVLVSLDGQPITSRETFMRLMADKEWGDHGLFVVQRGDQTVRIPVAFVRKPLVPPAAR